MLSNLFKNLHQLTVTFDSQKVFLVEFRDCYIRVEGWSKLYDHTIGHFCRLKPESIEAMTFSGKTD